MQVNFVASADGAATVSGVSAGLSSPADTKVFELGRDLADVVLVGAGTALAENYGGVRRTEPRGARRDRLGLPTLLAAAGAVAGLAGSGHRDDLVRALCRVAGVSAAGAVSIAALAVLGDGYYEITKHVWLSAYLLDATGLALLGAILAVLSRSAAQGLSGVVVLS